jgi:hypothetical protein
VFVDDPLLRPMPPPNAGSKAVMATKASIAVCTMHPQFAETTIELATSISSPLAHLVFEGELETPGRKIAVSGSDSVPIVSMNVRETVTPVKIWVNDLREPDYVQVLAEADFSDVLPYSAPRKGEEMDRPTAERLAAAARKLASVEAEFAQITAGIKSFSQQSRVNLGVVTAIHEIQEGIFGEIGTQFPDLRDKVDNEKPGA